MKRIPRHIGIIPDGNRRWARQNGLLQAARAYGIQELTYYGFTVDNCKRPKEQVAAFSDACVSAVKLLKQEAAELHVIGNTGSPCFPAGLLPYTKGRPEQSRQKDALRVNFLVNYGWEWDMKNRSGDPLGRNVSAVRLSAPPDGLF